MQDDAGSRRDQARCDQARDVLYTALGLGILGFQRGQVRRRELEKRLAAGLSGAGPVLRQARTTVRSLTDPVLDEVERHVPEPGRSALHLARVGAVALGDRMMAVVDPPVSRDGPASRDS